MDTGDIYKITCVVSNKSYVGQALHFVGKNRKKHGAKGRWTRHVSKAFNAKQPFSEGTVWHAIKTHGKHAFVIDVLESCCVSDLSVREEYYIRRCNTMAPNGYNQLTGEPRVFNAKVMSEEYRLTLSRVHKANTPGQELPMYMVYIKARPLQYSGEGYAIINHPNSRAKYFVSTKLSLEQKKNLATTYLQQLSV